MKIADGLKIIENGWIKKPKGFRVSFQKQTDSGMEAGLSPPADAAPPETVDLSVLCEAKNYYYFYEK
jgi:hypothetical protein